LPAGDVVVDESGAPDPMSVAPAEDPVQGPPAQGVAGEPRRPRRRRRRPPRLAGRGRAFLGLGDHASQEPKKGSHEAVVRGSRANGMRGRVPPVGETRIDGIEARRLGGRATGGREAGRGEGRGRR
jgi:hypothetical protein